MPQLERLSRENFDGFVGDIERLAIDCDLELTGDLGVALEPHEVGWLEEAAELLHQHGHEHELFDEAAIRAEVASPTYLGGIWDKTDAALVDPGKLAAGLARAALAAGVRIHERSPATKLVEDGAGIRVLTPIGHVRARRVLLATSAYPPLLRAIRRYIAPTTVNEGDTLTIDAFVTNTSATDTINDITTYGSIDRGSISSATLCSVENKTPTGSGATTRCLPTTPDVGPGDSSAMTIVNIDTAGLVGQTIHWSTFDVDRPRRERPDRLRRRVRRAGSRQCGHRIPGGQRDAGQDTPQRVHRGSDTVAEQERRVGRPPGRRLDARERPRAPYTTTLAMNSLAQGTHTLTATAHQDGAPFDLPPTQITIHVAAAPTVSVVPPAGFSPPSLNSTKTFTANATPGTPATIGVDRVEGRRHPRGDRDRSAVVGGARPVGADAHQRVAHTDR